MKVDQKSVHSLLLFAPCSNPTLSRHSTKGQKSVHSLLLFASCSVPTLSRHSTKGQKSGCLVKGIPITYVRVAIRKSGFESGLCP